jgi:hypothetical protein
VLGHVELIEHLADLQAERIGAGQSAFARRGDDRSSSALVASSKAARYGPAQRLRGMADLGQILLIEQSQVRGSVVGG